jgi:SAM-dependent methyltransferase
VAVRERGDADRPFAGGTASFYARYRRSYPAGFRTRLQVFGRGGRGRLLDLGCGTGQLLLQLAPFFEQAVGIDPEPDMLREAKRIAGERGVVNVEWIRGGSGELQGLQPVLGEFDLVTIGTAFHFMDPYATLSQLQRIAPEGAVTVAYNGRPMWLHTDPWAKAVRSVLESRLGQLSDADFTTDALDAAEVTMHNLGYRQVERWEQTRVEEIDSDFIVGHILSAISTEQVPATERQPFAHELSTAITAIEPSGRVLEEVPVRAVIGHTT